MHSMAVAVSGRRRDSLSVKSVLSSSPRKISFLAMPRMITWWRTPVASRRAYRGMSTSVGHDDRGLPLASQGAPGLFSIDITFL